MLFLIYLVVISMVINVSAVVSTSQGSDRRLLLLSCILEAAVSAIATLLILSPVGSLALSSCPSEVYQGWGAEWHPWLHNPPHTNCASEVVYPLYSAPLVYYGFSAASLFLLRVPLPLHSSRFCPPSLLTSLLAVPIQAAVQGGIGSVHFLCFPGIVLVAGLGVDLLVAYKGVRASLLSPLPIAGFLLLRVAWSSYAVAALLDATDRPLSLLPISILVPIIPIAELVCSLALEWRRRAQHAGPRRAPPSDPDPVMTSGPVYVGESPVPESQTRLRTMAGSAPRERPTTATTPSLLLL